MSQATNENLYYQAILMNAEYTEEDIRLVYSVLSPEEKKRIDAYRKQLKTEYRRGLAHPIYRSYFELKIRQRLFRAINTLVDIASRNRDPSRPSTTLSS